MKYKAYLALLLCATMITNAAPVQASFDTTEAAQTDTVEAPLETEKQTEDKTEETEPQTEAPSEETPSDETPSDETSSDETSSEEGTEEQTENKGDDTAPESTEDTVTPEVKADAPAMAPVATVEAEVTATEESTEVAPHPIGTEFSIGNNKWDSIKYRVTANEDTLEVEAYDAESSLIRAITIPETVTYEDVTYQVTSIPSSGFHGCSLATSIVLPEGMRTVGRQAFKDCNAVEEITLPSTLESFTVVGFKSLRKINLADANPYFDLVEGVLFTEDKTRLHLYPAYKPESSFDIPSTTTTLGERAFYNNQNLEKLVLPDSITTVEGYALDQVYGLRTFVDGSNVTKFGEANLHKCPNLENVTLKGSYMIGNYSINECPSVEIIHIEGNIKGHGAYALYDLPSLKEYTVNEGNEYFNAKDGVLFNGDKLLRYPAGKDTATYVVPDSTEEIAALAFNWMQHTNEIILPEGVEIRTQAFNYANRNEPIDIYFRDTASVNLNGSSFFVALLDGSNIYLPTEEAKESFLSYGNTIESEAGVNVNVAVKKIPVKEITFNETNKELKPHKIFTLVPEITPYYATEDVTWSTTNEAVATVEDGVVTTVGYGECQILLTSASGVKAVCDVAVVQTDINTIDISEVKNQPYTGEQVTPDVTLTDGDYTLVEGTDYTVSYGENVNVGEATVTLEGKGDYKGTKTMSFEITPKDFRAAAIAEIEDQEYTGKAVEPKLVVTDGEETLKEDTDYTVSYENNTNAGTATVTIEGKGNYSGEQKKTFVIEAKNLKKVDIAKIDALTYTGKLLAPKLTITDGEKELKKDVDYTTVYKDNLNAGTATVVVTGKGNYKGRKELTFEIKAKDLEKVETAKLDAQEYTGEALTPDVTVTDGETVLTKDTDYTVSYKDNTNAGTAKVIIEGKGNYKGKKEVEFKITKKDIQKTIVSDIDDQVFDGDAFTPEVTVKDGERTLKLEKDYSVTYKDNVNVGTATVIIEGKGNYTGSKTLTFKIGAEHLKNVSISEIAPFDYDGTAKEPDVEVTDDGHTLVKGVDYEVSYFDNTNAGTAKMIVTGIGNYVGEREISFMINAKAMDSIVISELEAVTYNGTAFTPDVVVMDGEKELRKGTDYTVSYENNRNAGTAKVTVTGIGNYKGNKETSFEIQSKALDSSKILEIAACEYNGNEQKPSVVVKDGSVTLEEGKDYTVAYENNVNAGTGKAVVTGMGNYTGTKEAAFTILAKQMEGSLSVEDQIYTGEALTPEVTVTDGENVLEKDVDYTVEYQNNTEIGMATVIVTGIGNYTGTKSITFRIGKDMASVSAEELKSLTFTGKELTPDVVLTDGEKTLVKGTDYEVSYQNNVNAGTATVVVTGLGDYVGTMELAFTITAKAMDDVVIAPIEDQTHTGEAVTPNVTLKDGDYTLVADKDYTLTYENNVEVGTATVTITGIGNYEGELSTTFVIVEAPVVPEEKPEEKPTTPSDTDKEDGKAPKTADFANPLGYSVLLGLSGLASALGIRKKRKDEDQ